MNNFHNYHIYDLYLSSTFPLPGLRPHSTDNVELWITDQEKIPPFEVIYKEGWMYEDFLFIQIGPQGIILLIKDICRIWLKESHTLVIEPNLGIDLEEAKVYLLGSGITLYMINQGHFTLHAGTVTDGVNCISFMGDSGAGKSTTCTYFIDRGYSLLADDVSLVTLSRGAAPLVWPALPLLKLWPDSLNQLQRDPERLPLVVYNENKRWLSVKDAFSRKDNAMLSCIFLLEPNETISRATISRLTGKESFDAIASNIYRSEAVTWLGQTANHFQFCTQLAQQVPVFRLQRPNEPFDLESIYQLVEKTVASL